MKIKKNGWVVSLMTAAAVAAGGLFSSAAHARPTKLSVAPVYTVIPKKLKKKKKPKLMGTSTITRDKSGISFTIRTTGLVKGDAYTVWVVFKQKTDSKEDKMVAVHATGGVVQSDVTHFSGRVGVGRAWDARGKKQTVRFGGEFFDPMKAMVIFRIVNHGKAEPKYLHLQLTTRMGGNCKNRKGNKDPNAKPCLTVQGSKPHKVK